RGGAARTTVRRGRPCTREAVDMAQAAHRLGDRCESGPAGVRAGLAVAGDARQDEAAVDLGEPLVPEAPALERPRPEVLGQHLGYTHQLEQQLLAAGRAEVERHALLVPRLDGPH